MNAPAADTTRSSTACPSIFTTLTWLGWASRFSSRFRLLHRIMTREILMPPEVEPAHAPVNISITSAIRQNVGHRAKSTVA